MFTERAAENQRAGPLAGMRVIDAATVYAGPLAATMLGDFGADVIKVEHPDGDSARTHGRSKNGVGLWWKVLGRNKRTVTAKLSTPQGRELFLELVRTADVLIENFRPGVFEKWDLSPELLHEINPGLIVLRVTGFGQTGPAAHRRAFGTLIEAMSGLAHLTGDPDGPPTLPPFGLADGTAALAGAYAATLALLHRERGGAGQVIDLSLLEPLLMILGPAPTVYDQLGEIPGRHGNRSPNNAPRNTYLTRDGRWVAVSASSLGVAERVMTLVGHPELVAQPWFSSAGKRVEHADELDGHVAEWIGARDEADVVAEFERVGAALAPVYTVQDLVNDRHVIERDIITTVDDHQLGPIRMQNVMFRMSGTPGGIAFTGRDLGEDNDEVYVKELAQELGRLRELKDKGVL
ncbi:CaiB/BaiF CoA transferase family protein [Pseudonocardia sp. H11422]|uniref:CaiB/BaiF CoA transferase family protein n=1 Tax=Pseudonocardia sp. H11422 TaxID=2835866 RepID=UPI001BDD2E2F|nr:CoA transferase [Pseudonocardia sp. H11422]